MTVCFWTPHKRTVEIVVVYDFKGPYSAYQFGARKRTRQEQAAKTSRFKTRVLINKFRAKKTKPPSPKAIKNWTSWSEVDTTENMLFRFPLRSGK